jgi:hypothetical protein
MRLRSLCNSAVSNSPRSVLFTDRRIARYPTSCFLFSGRDPHFWVFVKLANLTFFVPNKYFCCVHKTPKTISHCINATKCDNTRLPLIPVLKTHCADACGIRSMPRNKTSESLQDDMDMRLVARRSRAVGLGFTIPISCQ